MADLLCAEGIVDRRAELDPVIYNDVRVLENLLAAESTYVPRLNYFHQLQPDIKPFMRKVVATWMMEVCEEEHCEDQVFSTAINLLDRFLCECTIDKTQLQMIACVCMLVASKVRQCHSLTVGRLVYFTDFSITPDQLRQFEVLMLARLNWDLSSITGFDYVDHVLERVTWSREQPQVSQDRVRRHARTLVDLCYCEPILIRKKPSLIASACVVSAARGLKIPGSSVASVCALTRCRTEEVNKVVSYIDSVVDSHLSTPNPRPPPSAPTAASKTPATPEDNRQPETPTDVQEIFF